MRMEIEINDSKYLSASSTQTGDIVTIADEGIEAEIKQKDGTMKKVYNFKVVCNDKEYIYTPTIKTLKLFVMAWGKSSQAWIGKKFQVKHVTIEVAGKEMVVLRATIM